MELERSDGPSAYGLRVFAEINDPDYEGRSMVYVEDGKGHCASYGFASEQGELDAGDVELSKAQVDWLNNSTRVLNFLIEVNY